MSRIDISIRMDDAQMKELIVLTKKRPAGLNQEEQLRWIFLTMLIVGKAIGDYAFERGIEQ